MLRKPLGRSKELGQRGRRERHGPVGYFSLLATSFGSWDGAGTRLPPASMVHTSESYGYICAL